MPQFRFEKTSHFFPRQALPATIKSYVTAYLPQPGLDWLTYTHSKTGLLLLEEIDTIYEMILGIISCQADPFEDISTQSTLRARLSHREFSNTDISACDFAHNVRLPASESLVQAKELHCKWMGWIIMGFALHETRKFPRSVGL